MDENEESSNKSMLDRNDNVGDVESTSLITSNESVDEEQGRGPSQVNPVNRTGENAEDENSFDNINLNNDFPTDRGLFPGVIVDSGLMQQIIWTWSMSTQ